MHSLDYDPKEQAIEIQKLASAQIDTKFAKGQQEHGGNFFTKPTVKNIREEVLDLVAYTHVVELHQKQLLEKVEGIIAFIYSNDCNLADVVSQLEKLKDQIKTL